MATRRSALLTAFASAILCIRCTSSTTSVVAPSADKCQVSASTSAGSFTANGGSGTVTVSAPRDCTWSLSADAGWISIAGPPTGQGESAVPYAVQPNPTPVARSGAIVVGSVRLTIAQAGVPCRFDLSRAGDTIGAEGGRLTVGVTTLTGCAWNATSGAGWISVTSGQDGNGSGTVGLSVAANSGDARVGLVNVAGENYTVSQEGTAPRPPGTTVEFSGPIANLAGLCPDVTFSIRDVTVAADASTNYKHGQCGDLRNGNNVSVTGVVQRDLTVRATTLELKKSGQ